MSTTFKFLKQFNALFFGNAWPGVPNPNPNMLWMLGRTQYPYHNTPFGGIAQGIADKVLDNTTNPLWVGINPELHIMHTEFNATLCCNRFKLQA